MSKLSTFFVVLILTLAAAIKFDQGGYTDIRVAIHHSIPENKDIIEKLKRMFTKASSSLHRALNGQAYFREITIVVPKNWTLKGMHPEFLPTFGGHHFSTADVRVDEPNPLHGIWPYTVQPGLCGEEGQYIHLTPEFLNRVSPELLDMAGRALVPEWAHLRYAVFNEYGDRLDPLHPSIYDDGSELFPTACTQGIFGYLWHGTGKCEINQQGYGMEDCWYIPNLSHFHKASIMAYPYSPNVNYFCTDDEDQSERIHNRRAPNKHNRMCNSRSTWSVISSHQDFKTVKEQSRNGIEVTAHAAPGTITPSLNTTPKFVIKKIEDDAARIVLILDVSRRMRDEYKLEYLKESTTRFLRDRVPIGSLVGIIIFDDTARNLTEGLVRVSGQSTRDQLIGIVSNLTTGSDANITAGLMEGLLVASNRWRLMLRKGPAEESTVVIVLGGGEDAGSAGKAVEELVGSEAVVNVVVLGNPDSTVTQVDWHFFDTRLSNGTIVPTEVDDAFFSAIMAQTNLDDQPIIILKENVWLNQSKRLSFVVDKDIATNITITIICHYIRSLSARLIDPVGKEEKYNPNSDQENYEVDEAAKRMLVRIPMAMMGRWTVVLNSSAEAPVNLDVEVVAHTFMLNAESNQPIRLHSRLLASPQTGIVRIFADVKKHYNPVLEAEIVAFVETPKKTIKIMLKDDGIGADVTKNDGIYSEFFTTYEAAGRYKVFIRLTDDRMATIRMGQKASSGAPPFPDMQLLKGLSLNMMDAEESFSWSQVKLSHRREGNRESEDKTVKDANRFLVQRYRFAGSFQVTEDMVQAARRIPPNRVTDLTVLWTQTGFDGLFATLTWTSPGDDMQTGNASWIELRGSSNWNQLQDSFPDAHQFVNISQLQNPLPGGSIETMDVEVPLFLVEDQLFAERFLVEESVYISLYFALRAHDEDGNAAEVSNIASARFVWNMTLPLVVREASIDVDAWAEAALVESAVGEAAGNVNLSRNATGPPNGNATTSVNVIEDGNATTSSPPKSAERKKPSVLILGISFALAGGAMIASACLFVLVKRKVVVMHRQPTNVSKDEGPGFEERGRNAEQQANTTWQWFSLS